MEKWIFLWIFLYSIFFFKQQFIHSSIIVFRKVSLSLKTLIPSQNKIIFVDVICLKHYKIAHIVGHFFSTLENMKNNHMRSKHINFCMHWISVFIWYFHCVGFHLKGTLKAHFCWQMMERKNLQPYYFTCANTSHIMRIKYS